MSADTESQFSQGITGAILKVKLQANEAINNVVTPIPYPPLQPDIYQVEARIKEDMINVSGQSATERGATQATSTRTFRELAQMDKGAKNRRSDQVDTFEDFVEDISRNWIALLQQYADLPFYVSVTGDEPQGIIQAIAKRKSAAMPGAVTSPQGFTFTKEDIQGEFDVEVVAGSTLPLDSDNRMQRLMEILGELPQLGIMPGGPVIAAIGKGLAQELDMPDVELAIAAEQQVAQQRAAAAKQQQDTLTAAQTAKDSAEIELKAQKEATNQQSVQIQAFQAMEQIRQAQQKLDAEIEAMKKERLAEGD
jgi:hypothetical protein